MRFKANDISKVTSSMAENNKSIFLNAYQLYKMNHTILLERLQKMTNIYAFLQHLLMLCVIFFRPLRLQGRDAIPIS